MPTHKAWILLDSIKKILMPDKNTSAALNRDIYSNKEKEHENNH